MNADAAQMNVLQERERLNRLSHAVIGAAQKVSSSLGYGFLEKVYENALVVELRAGGVAVQQQEPVKVRYAGFVVGDYVADLIVDRSIIIEVKALPALAREHRHQCLNYLRAANLNLALLLNFGRPHLEVGRVVWQF